MSDIDNLELQAHWKRQGGLLAIFLLVLAVCYYPTFVTMVEVWLVSDTYAHCFVILPICFWLIWRIRHQIASRLPQTNYLGIPILLLLGFIWLFANYVGIQAAEHLAVTLMIPVLIFTLLGWQATSVMVFPLAFLVFAVPIGEELTPVLIDFTADFTVAMIQLTGIPIYREGTFFQLPTGSWSVVAACSGVRYLIASLTLGVLYAYLNYQSLPKRVIFILFAGIVPIIANGLRAFMIVMIGHLSGMELATGVDHLIYGWVFFGLVIGIMFYIGSFWRDDDPHLKLLSVGWRIGHVNNLGATYKFTVAAIAIALIFWPIKYHLEDQERDFSQVAQIDISTPSGWKKVDTLPGGWKPDYHGFDREFSSTYANAAGEKVVLFIGYYAQQRQGAEIGNHNNVLVAEKNETWRAIQGQTLALPNAKINAPTATIQGNRTEYLTSYFFYIDGQWATNKYHTTWLQAKARLLGGHDGGAIIVITTQQQESSQVSAKLLKQFIANTLGNIKFSLDKM